MNLATMLSIIFWLICAFSPTQAERALPSQPQSTQSKPSETQSSADQTSNPQPQTASPNQPPATSAGSQTPSSLAKKSHSKHKKKSASTSDCTAPATPNSPPERSASADATGTKPASSSNCPPPSKTVVKNGGTSEPAIQLTGGENTAQAQQRSNTDQLLGATEDNLKKISGRQLTSTQQEMVSQIHQYMEQSKEAVTAGDSERGRMLAQKARLLSDELVKP